MKIEIKEYGVMLSDYFQGTSGVWLNVSVDKNTTLLEIIDDLESEINEAYDHMDYTFNESHGYVGDYEKEIKEQLQTMRQYIKGKESKKYAPDLDYSFDDLEDFGRVPYAIFTIEFVEG